MLRLAGARWRDEIRTMAISSFALLPLAFALLIGGELIFPWLKETGEHVQHIPVWHNYTYPSDKDRKFNRTTRSIRGHASQVNGNFFRQIPEKREKKREISAKCYLISNYDYNAPRVASLIALFVKPFTCASWSLLFT